MAKLWGQKPSTKAMQQQKNYAKRVGYMIDKDIRPKIVHTPKLGIKSTVMIIYAQEGKLAAWQALQEYNKKLSDVQYTLEILESWIKEYENKRAQRVEKDDDFDR